MVIYFDSSVIMRIVLGDPRRLQREWKLYPLRLSSELSEVECLRTIDRLRLRDGLSQDEAAVRRRDLYEWFQGLERVKISPAILQRASAPLPVPLGTLDAIHLSTALLWQEERESDLIMATHDLALARAAKAFGMETIGS